MPVQLSTAVRNARLDAIETAIGASAILRIRSGAVPANCAAADAGLRCFSAFARTQGSMSRSRNSAPTAAPSTGPWSMSRVPSGSAS